MEAADRQPPSEIPSRPEPQVRPQTRIKSWILHPRSILSALLLWSGIGIVIGGVVEIVFAQMASGIWVWEGRLSMDSARWYDVTRSAIATVGLFGLGGAALLAYRRQHTSEGQHALDRERQILEVRKQSAADTSDLRSRYAVAAEQLGHERPAVRLAGVYAMGSLADDWQNAGSPKQQKVCVDVLCAYLRMAYDPESDRAKEGEREVRHTIIRVISAHLQDPHTPETWCGLDLDFTKAVFDGGDFSGAKFTGGWVNFHEATFTEGWVTFERAEFSDVRVDFHSHFAGGTLLFLLTEFKQGCWVSFFDAELSDGQVQFTDSKFIGGSVDFNSAAINGGEVLFMGASFDGSTVDFRNCSGKEPGKLNFIRPKSWAHPPLVDWYDGPSPSWVRPATWPPHVSPSANT